jgi:hypothetical protein
MTRQEQVCAAIVADILGGKWSRIEEHSHDFDIEFGDRPSEWLEISAFTDQDVEGRWHRTPPPWESSVLTTRWSLHVTSWADLRTVQQAAEPHLATLENEGLRSFFAGDYYSLLFRVEPDPFSDTPTNPVVIAYRELGFLGVEDAVSLSGGGHPAIDIAQSVTTVGSPTGLLNGAVASVANRPDNIAKLTSSERKTHLFIPIRIPGGGVWSVVQQGPPSEPPMAIDPAIGRVWVLGRGERVLFFDRGSDWEAAEFDPGVFSTPEAWSV